MTALDRNPAAFLLFWRTAYRAGWRRAAGESAGRKISGEDRGGSLMQAPGNAKLLSSILSTEYFLKVTTLLKNK